MAENLVRNVDLLQPGPIRQIRLDLTTRCNLRCVYCAVSQRSYAGADMPNDRLTRLIELITALHRFHPLAPIDMNGHGETTILPGWVSVFERFFTAGIDIRLTSNFSKEFDQSELETLARLRGIGISIDTVDRRLLQRMRRRVDVRQIITNIHLVRAAASRISHKPPDFHFLCGLYDFNAYGTLDFARVAVSLGIKHVAFWNLTPYPFANTDVLMEDRVQPLDDLPDEELRPRVMTILSAIGLLRRSGVSVHVQGDFVNTLARRVKLAHGPTGATSDAHASTNGWFDPRLP